MRYGDRDWFINDINDGSTVWKIKTDIYTNDACDAQDRDRPETATGVFYNLDKKRLPTEMKSVFFRR